jgi:hypothetical protein
MLVTPASPKLSMDRRSTRRYAIHQLLRYRLLDGNMSEGMGKTINIATTGVLFTTDRSLTKGRMVQVAVNWPALLHGTCPLNFVASGPVVRSEGKTTAMRIERYEFRTRTMRVA